jgi:hypothetical protein
MTTQLRLGIVGDVTATNAVTCVRCCCHLEGDDLMPHVNGTHLINGKDISPGSPFLVGFGFDNGVSSSLVL